MDTLSLHANGNGSMPSNGVIGKPITCKAAVAWGPGHPLTIEEIGVDPPQKLEVRIKILFTSICHTDVSAWQGENEAQRAYPRILGHEASGSAHIDMQDINDADPEHSPRKSSLINQLYKIYLIFMGILVPTIAQVSDHVSTTTVLMGASLAMLFINILAAS